MIFLIKKYIEVIISDQYEGFDWEDKIKRGRDMGYLKILLLFYSQR